jgi:hypothetical protein
VENSTPARQAINPKSGLAAAQTRHTAPSADAADSTKKRAKGCERSK